VPGSQAVIFDIDGTLLDSADGIVAGFRHALQAMGLTPPEEAVLRSDVGPPVGQFLTSAGVGADRLGEAVATYRDFYARDGMRRSSVFPGVPELLDRLRQQEIALGTASAKRVDVAHAILDHHRLADRFTVINGGTDARPAKTDTLRETLRLLGDPENQGEGIMVGDRASDVAAARDCGIGAVAVAWGYGSLDELAEAAPDALLELPQQLLELLGC